MRRLALFAAAVPLLFAAACGGAGGETATGSGPSATAAGTPVASASDLKVTGEIGSKPQVTFPEGAPPKTSSSFVLKEGSGTPAKDGDTVVANLSAFNWDGKENRLALSTYDKGLPEVIPVDGKALPKVVYEAFRGAKPGSRLVTVVAVDSLTPQQLEQAKKAGTDKIASLFVIDVVDTAVAKAAQGPATDPGIEGITLKNPGGDEAPVLTTKTDRKAPEDLIAKTVIKGSGPAVKKGQLLLVQYTGKIWGTDKEFDSSWRKGKPTIFQIGTGKVIKGWDQSLVGVPVGSRVLLSIPPKYGYGDKGQGPIKGTDTLVFVVDVLGAY